MIYFAAFAMLYLLHLVLKINWIVMAVLTMFFLIMIPIHRRKWKQYQGQLDRFYEASFYMEHILYGFLREQKIDKALINVQEAMPVGHMKEVVRNAVYHMQMSYEDVELMENSLKMIEEEYPCRRLLQIHQLMLHGESYGGDVEYPVNLLLEEKSAWENRTLEMMQERKKQFSEVILSILVSLAICGIVLHFPVMNVDISGNLITQILSVVVIVLDDMILLKAQGYLSVDYLTLDMLQQEEYYIKKMKNYQEYDEKKEQKLSIALASGFLVVVVLFFVTGRYWAGAIGLFVLLLLFNQHKVGRFLAKKTLVKNISCAFPNWLMDLVLLMQMENVQMALIKSKQHVPGVLKQELDILVEGLEMNPESFKPYEGFLKEFQIPQVQSAMSMLYSLSMGNCGNARKQISELISRNQKMLDTGERIRLKDLNSGMYLLFLAPVLTASVKLVTDMAVFMVVFLQNAVI